MKNVWHEADSVSVLDKMLTRRAKGSLRGVKSLPVVRNTRNRLHCIALYSRCLWIKGSTIMWLSYWVTAGQWGLFESLFCTVRDCAKSQACLRQSSPASTSHTCSVTHLSSLSLSLCLYVCVFSSGLYFIIFTFSFLFPVSVSLLLSLYLSVHST